MPITKLGRDLVRMAGETNKFEETVHGIEKQGSLIGAIVGGVRAHNLSAEEEAALKKYYNLNEDSSLTLRNVGRGIVGGALGGLPGKGLAMLGASRGNLAMTGIGNVLDLIGTGVGAKYLTDKYSQGEAQRILNKTKQP